MSEAYQKLGRYLLIEEIAAGGMALIYRAKLVGVEGFEKEFAIKKILPYWSHNAEFITMLIDEAKTLVPLHHNNIVQVFELGKDKDSYFIVMEFVHGVDLKKLIKTVAAKNQALALNLILYVAREICAGLEFAHARKNHDGTNSAIVHRDISPQNILLSFDGQVKITDFGIAKVTGKSSKTQTGVLKGKFSYMSPEQAVGKDIDAQTDIFALGSVIFEMATGRKCFDGQHDLEILERVKSANVVLPKDLAPELTTILQKALAAAKSDRYANITLLRRDIEKLIGQLKEPADSVDLKNTLAAHFENIPKTPQIELAKSNDKTKIIIPEDPTHKPITTKIPDSVYTIVSEHTVVSAQVDVQNENFSPDFNQQHFIQRHHRKIILGIGLLLLALTFLKYDSIKQSPTVSPMLLDLPSEVPQIVTPIIPPVEAKPVVTTLPVAEAAHVDTQPLPIATFGTLKIDARPWGIATVNGQEKSTPATFRLPVNTSTLTVTFPPKHQKVSKTIEIKTDQTTTCRASFTSKGNGITCD